MKKITLGILTATLISSSLFAKDTNTLDSLNLYNVNLEKTILEEMVAAMVHEQTIFDKYNKFILKTGDVDINAAADNLANGGDGDGIHFYGWYNIDDTIENNFLAAYNHAGGVNLSYDNFTLSIKNTFKKANNYAYDRYIKELKNRNIKYSLDSDGYSEVRYKLPLKTIKFMYKYKEIVSQGLAILDDNEILDNAIITAKLVDLGVNKSDIYVPDGEGGFVMYNADKSTTPLTLDYLGVVNTFNGVVVEGSTNNAILQANLNKKLPKIKGSIGNVIMDIKDESGNWIKSAIIEYIYTGHGVNEGWKKRYSTVNRKSFVTTSVKDKFDSTTDLVGNDNISFQNVNMFESTFVGGLYNKDKVTLESTVTLVDESDPLGNQFKDVNFEPVETWDYDFKNIYGRSFVYSNTNLDQIGGSIEELFLIAENIKPGYIFKADTSACDSEYVYDSSDDKCKKAAYSCFGNSEQDVVYLNGVAQCVASDHDNPNTNDRLEEICSHGPSHYKFEEDLNACADKKNSNDINNLCGDNWEVGSDKWINKANGDDCKVLSNGIEYEYKKIGDGWSTQYWGHITNKILCDDYKGYSGFMQTDDGCFWTPNNTTLIQDPYCSGDDVRVGGVCRDVYDGSIDNAECDGGSSQAADKFEDLIENYFFNKPEDKDKYVFGALGHIDIEKDVHDSDTGETHKVCMSIQYSQKAYKTYYVYPSFDINIKDIEKQVGHEFIIPGTKYSYKEVKISECDWVGNNCKTIFNNDDLIDGFKRNNNIPYSYGEIFKPTEEMKWNDSSKNYEIRKSHFNNVQMLPFSTFTTINDNLNTITNHSNNRTMKVQALEFEIKNSSLYRLKLNSGEVPQ